MRNHRLLFAVFACLTFLGCEAFGQTVHCKFFHTGKPNEVGISNSAGVAMLANLHFSGSGGYTRKFEVPANGSITVSMEGSPTVQLIGEEKVDKKHEVHVASAPRAFPVLGEVHIPETQDHPKRSVTWTGSCSVKCANGACKPFCSSGLVSSETREAAEVAANAQFRAEASKQGVVVEVSVSVAVLW